MPPRRDIHASGGPQRASPKKGAGFTGMPHRYGLISHTITWAVVIFLWRGVESRITPPRSDVEGNGGQNPGVLLSVSSLASHNSDGAVTERLLELNWFDAPPGMNQDPASWVGLFDHDPSEGRSDALEVAPTRNYPEGYYRTKVPFPRMQFSEEKLGDGCLGFWIGYVNLNRLMSKSCLRARPHWMHDMRDTIGNRTLTDIMLPGTHNAGAYEPYRPDRNTPKIRYQICHDEDIFQQLVYGNRFLDLRVLFQHVAGSKEKFWISHSILRTNNSVREVLEQVKRFMDSTNEIVVMDFHLFYMGFIDSWVDDRHRDLMSLIVRTLGHHMLPASYNLATTPLNEIWHSGKRLIVGYASKQGAESNMLFPGAFHLWGNKETKPELEEFLDRNVCHFRHKSLWSAMAELTPTTSGVLIDKYGGLRSLAQDVNQDVTRWFRERWWRCANVVSTDFFLGNNMVDVAIESNRRKFS